MIQKYVPIILLLFFLTACWNNQEIDKQALVHGVGISKGDEQFKFTVEIVKPISQFGQSSQSEESGENLIIDIESESFLEGARELIRKAKRRPYFGHTRVWIFSEEMAKEDSVRTIDNLRRDQMLRIDSYLFITKDDPREILSTPTLYEVLSSIELTSALDQTKYISKFTPIKMYEFFRLIEGPISNAYIPLIKAKEEDGQKITEFNGTAVIKKDKMVGKLDETESIGLTWLLDKVEGGSITVELYNNEAVSLEINKTKTKLKPHLQGNKLEVQIDVEIEGTLGDNMTPQSPTEKFFKEVEATISNKVKEQIRNTLKTLQEDLKTDITGIGIETYRKYPQEWQKIRSKWDEVVFANATVAINVKTNFDHQGLINKSINRNEKKPNNIPFPYFN